jgi:hypothetical protein
MKRTMTSPGPGHRFTCVALLMGLLSLGGGAQPLPIRNIPTGRRPDATPRARSDFEVRTGIEVVALRLSAAGNLLDFRYKVLDPERARAILQSQTKPALVVPSTGLKLTVPDMAYVGALRQTAVAPQAGKTYFILFSNPRRVVQAGQKLDLLVGDMTLHGIPVE